MYQYSIICLLGLALAACQPAASRVGQPLSADSSQVVQPVAVTDPVGHDSDDPAVWINPTDPARSLIIGTDKDSDGGLYVYDLAGHLQADKTVHGLKRPNNVDVEYGLMLNGKPTDIAVTTERETHNLRIFSLPDMKPIDGGGIPMFEGETGTGYRDLMGIALYRTKTGDIQAIVGRKNGPTDGAYLWQYRLADAGNGQVKATMLRKFGRYSGRKEIESIAVDDQLGYVYYSDEGVGVRQYFADPARGNEQLALFATKGFVEDHEGISIYATSDTTGYLVVSDQGGDRFQIFRREGEAGQPYAHPWIRTTRVLAHQSDGSETISRPLNNQFRHGLFIAMSDNRTFQLYRCEDVLGDLLKR